MKRTPLYDTHRELGARMVEFGGWEMPVQYTSILEEHHAVRRRAGLFDVSHMGEVEMRGPDALRFLRRLITNDPAALAVGQAQYTLMCLDTGGIVDDLIVYRLGEDHFITVVNASNTDKDYAWMESHAEGNFKLNNISDTKALLALQGPLALAILQPLTDVTLSGVGYYYCTPGQVAGIPALIMRTGYTGEDGFELMVASEQAARLWKTLMEAGSPHGLLPAGLGARDTLRLEASMPLYGHELNEATNPLEAGLSRYVKLEKDFIGREAILAARDKGLARHLIGLELLERGIPRQDYPIQHAGQTVGRVTSGTLSPTLDKPIGMGFVPPTLTEPGTEIDVVIRNRPVRAQVVKRPFYKRSKT